jgi:hypothetical protein
METYHKFRAFVVARSDAHLGHATAIRIDSDKDGIGGAHCTPPLVCVERLNVVLLKTSSKITRSNTTQLSQTARLVSFVENLEALELALVLPVRAVGHVVAFQHLLVRQPGAVIADAPGLDGHEKGLAILVLLLDELGVVIELVCESKGQSRKKTTTTLPKGVEIARRAVSVSSSIGRMVS